MNRRGNPIVPLIVILIIAGALLQLKIYNKSLNFGQELNKFIESQEVRELKTDNTNKKETVQADEGDWLVWAYSVEPKTLNMISADNDIYSSWITTPYILEPLLDYDYDTMELKPCLAESFSISEDGLEVNFKLRDDIYFSDGVPVTTDDVVFTFNTVMNPKIDAAPIAQMFTDVDKLVPIDDKQFKFIMKRPFFKTLDNLSFADVGIYPKHIYELMIPLI
jgi:peptide/nickel transport system substrate-binding protein